MSFEPKEKDQFFNIPISSSTNDTTHPSIENAVERSRKSDGKFVLIVIFLIILLLALASIITFYYLETKKNLDALNSPSSSSQKSVIKVNTVPSLSTGKDTPAAKSIKNTEQKITKEWLSKNFKAFGNDVLDQNNDCVKLPVCANDSDPDNDGLKNIYEYQYATDPNSSDTDRDGLGDGDELLVYYSNPNSKDSTVNGISDSDKLITCKNLIEPIDSGSLSINYLLGLSERVSLYPLHSDTQKTIQNAGGTIFDIQNNGYIKSVCDSLK
jgi:hypothetical protein